MALVVEDGSGLSTAESYISVADADAYFAARNLTLWADSGFSDTEKEGCLRRATDYMRQAYRMRWAGRRVSTTQALDWPRYDVPRPDMGECGGYVLHTEIPQEVIDACAELAWRAAFGELSPDVARRAVREKVDVIEVEYDRFAPAHTRFRAVDNMLAPYLTGSGSSAIKVLRA